jgi:hypothetical protein
MDLAAMDLEACEKGFNASASAAMMPFAASMFFGVHFMMAMQLVNAPFTMFQDKILDKFFWGPLQGEDAEARDVDAIFAKPSDVLLQDPTLVPPTLQLTRRQMRRKLIREGKDASKVVDERAPATEGVVKRTRAAGLRRLTAAGNADGAAAGDASTELAAGASGPVAGSEGDEEEEDAEYATFGEGYDELMEDVIFSAWEDDEAINVRAVEALKEGGKHSLQYCTDDDGWTMLMVACGTRAMPQRAVERLIELGCGPLGAQDRQGWTCLHWAAEHDCPQAVRGVGRWLLGRAPGSIKATSKVVEAILSVRSVAGRTALDHAEEEGHADAVAALKELGKDAGVSFSASTPVIAGAGAAEAEAGAGAAAAVAAPSLRRQHTSEAEPDDLVDAAVGELD